MEKINIFDNPEYNKYIQQTNDFKESYIGKYYESILCMKSMKTSKTKNKIIEKAYNNISEYITNDLDEILEKNECKLCVLPKNHAGKCKLKYTNIFKKDKVSKKIMNSINLCIYSTPGNDDYIFKNRCSRLFPIKITIDFQRKIKDKTKKLKCAISLNDSTSPFSLATSYLDWLTYILSIDGIENHLSDKYTDDLKNFINNHKEYLSKYFNNYNRKLFCENNKYSMCVITKHKFVIKDIADISRDNRIIINDFDIQLGHNKSRSLYYNTIRCCNIIPMSRRGNLIIGERTFTENVWREELLKILQ